MNQYQKQVLAAAQSMLGWPYKLGGRGGPKNNPPYGIDCRGYVQRAYKLAGAEELIGGMLPNVRAQVKWADDNGRFVGPEERPGLLWPVFYFEDTTKAEPGNPRHIRHVALVRRRINARYPLGEAWSAFNPKKGTISHGLNIPGLKILGYCKPDFAALDANEPPIVDPEPPVEGAQP